MLLLFLTRQQRRDAEALAESIRLNAQLAGAMPSEFRVVWRYRPGFGAWPYLEV